MKPECTVMSPIIAVVCITLAMLGGCSTFSDEPPEGFHWYRTRAASPVPYSVVYIAPELVPVACGTDYHACTIHSQRIIYVPYGAPEWYLTHERKHQEGYDHGS